MHLRQLFMVNDELPMFRTTQIVSRKISKVISPQNIYISAICLTIHFLSKVGVFYVNHVYPHLKIHQNTLNPHKMHGKNDFNITRAIAGNK